MDAWCLRQSQNFNATKQHSQKYIKKGEGRLQHYMLSAIKDLSRGDKYGKKDSKKKKKTESRFRVAAFSLLLLPCLEHGWNLKQSLD